MGIEIRTPVGLRASDVAVFLGAQLFGVDVRIKMVGQLCDVPEGALVFSKAVVEDALLGQARHVCFIASQAPSDTGHNSFIIVKNPKLAFAKVVNRFFAVKKMPGVGTNSVIHPSAKIAGSVAIGNGCTIGRNVVVGEGTELYNGVVIAAGVQIGKNCLIRSHAVIGEEGFGFAYEEDGTPFRTPQLGSVELGDFVEIGNFTAVARGTLGNTIIRSHVKVDNLVHIAHNCIIGERTMIVACAEVSGSVTVGVGCWLGAGCSVIQKVNLGDNCVVGIGAVIIRDVLPGAVVVGNPTRTIAGHGKL